MLHLLRPHPGWLALLAALILSAMGIFAIDVATPAGSVLMTKQAIFLGVAIVAMLFTALPHHRVIGMIALPLMIAVLVLLVIVILPLPRTLIPVRGGATRWIDLGPIQLQPSELAKIVFVLVLARYLRFRENYRTLKGLLLPLLITFVPMLLILKEPDLGTAMIFLPVLFAMLLAAGAKIKHLLVIVLLGLSLAPAMYPLLKDYQKDRIRAVVYQVRGETKHHQGIGFQGAVAMTLVGSGRTVGHDPGHARDLVRYNRLPERHNDLIFAVVCTRWGLIGGLTVLGAYVLFIVSGLITAASNKDPFARLVAVGVSAIVFTQMAVNIGMTVGMLPITGLSLPFISYGGSSLVANFLMVGLVMNVAARRPIIMARPAFEYGPVEALQ